MYTYIYICIYGNILKKKNIYIWYLSLSSLSLSLSLFFPIWCILGWGYALSNSDLVAGDLRAKREEESQCREEGPDSNCNATAASIDFRDNFGKVAVQDVSDAQYPLFALHIAITRQITPISQ